MVGQRSVLVASWAAMVAGAGLLLQTTPGSVRLLVEGDAVEGVRSLLWALAGPAPWLVGAWVVRRQPRLGVAVLVATTALTLPNLAWAVVNAPTGLRSWWAPVTLVTWAAMLTAGVVAWVGRPGGGWRAHGEVPGWLLVPIVLTFAPLLLPEVAQVGPDGAPLDVWFATNLGMVGGVTDAVVIVLPLVVVVAGTAILLQLGRRVVAAVLLAAAGPRLVVGLLSVAEASGSVQVQVMPGGVAAVVGSAILVVVATRWLTRDDGATLRPRADEGSLHNR